MGAAEPLVSVCMPLYNTERYIAAAIEGVLNQTHRNLELIVCDNCSTDGSVAIVEGYAARDNRLRLVRNRRNLGYAGNLHKATSLAHGEFMMVHCADDLAEPTALEKLVRLATGPDVDRDRVIAIADCFVADGEGQPTGVHTQRTDGFALAHETLAEYRATGTVRRFKGKQALAYALPRLAICGWMGATLYSRKLFESIEGVYNGLLYSPDLQFNYHLLSRDPDVLWLHEPLFRWRLHESGQIGLARQQAVPKLAWDGYTYTFHFPQSLLDELGVQKEEVARTFVDSLCLRRALAEIRGGSLVLAFRHLCIGLATYPSVTLRNPKFYLGAAGVLTGPVGRALARLGYSAGIFRGATDSPRAPDARTSSH
jgi:glycosyltransferase involved in cell wall biosynthesis